MLALLDVEAVDLRFGDCISGMTALDASSVDMILCDPPYEQTARNSWDKQIDMESMFEQVARVSKPRAAVVFFAQGMYTAQLMMGPWQKHWRYNLIWKKNKPRGFLNAKKMPLRYHEDIVVFYRGLPVYNPQMVETGKPINACTRKTTGSNYRETKGGFNERAGRTDRYPGSVLSFPVLNAEEKPVHPTQKPLSLCEFLVRSYSKPGDLILDMCAGSGTTAVACLRSGRRFVGFENNRGYYDKAMARIDGEEKR